MSLIFLYVYGMAPTLQATMQISGQLEWPTMSKMQNDCFGMTGLWWQYHHDHILKGRLFGRVDVCECDWCDCFFQCCMFYGWGGHRRWASCPHGPSGFKLLFYVTMGLTNSRYRRNVLFALAPHVNVRKQNLDTQNESETPQYLRVRSGEVVFNAIMHVVINTTSTLCSFVCTKSICYVHNSCAQVRLLCISLCYVYNIDFCAD